MKKFCNRILLFAFPLVAFLLLIIGTFYIFDPFKILKKYNEYNNSIVAYNEDYIATERYLKQKNDYNSFIFGSSRAGYGFQPEIWERYLLKGEKAYSFAAFNESIFGIIGKINLIDKEKEPIDNALIIIDPDVTFKRYTNSPGHIYIKHPLVSNETREAFISEYLRDYIFTGFFVAYLDYRIFKTKRSYMKGFLNFEVDTSEKFTAFNVKEREKLILADEKQYYAKRTDLFYERDSIEVTLQKQIMTQGIAYLRQIKRIFDRHKTSYKIIISPLYDQKKFNPTDITALNEIFGRENIYDYSGKNSITNDKTNYYENSHYRIQVGDEILKIIYATGK